MKEIIKNYWWVLFLLLAIVFAILTYLNTRNIDDEKNSISPISPIAVWIFGGALTVFFLALFIYGFLQK